MILALLLLASPIPQFPDDVPAPAGCNCLGLEEHDYDAAELRVRDDSGKIVNGKEFGRRWTCRWDRKVDFAAWAALLKEQGWDVLEQSDQVINAQKGSDRFIKSTVGLTVLRRAPLPPFSLPSPDVIAPLPGSTPLQSEQIEKGTVEMTHGAEGFVLHPPFRRERWAVPWNIGQVEQEARYEAALAAAGWEIAKRGQGGVLVAHFAKDGRDLWVKVTPSARDYMIELGDVGAQEAQARLAEELSAKGHVALYGLYFDTGSPQLKAASEGTLQRILALLQQASSLRLEVQGHTDNTGHNPGNQLLSEARAKSVVDWLTAHGVDATRLSAKGYADTRPVADNSTAGGRSLNRRVELAKLP
jgi:outer membrane protein OmpA-like peptidoglycan-associated protein